MWSPSAMSIQNVLVVDDDEAASAVREVLPRLDRGHVLITSRRQRWPRGVGKVDVDDHPELAGEYGVQGIPTLLVFQDGKVVDRVVGAVDKEFLAAKLDSRLPAA